MRKLLGLAGAFTIALSLTARGAGIVYTVPADYEKMKKVVEGLVGKQLNSVSLNQASNAGTNIRNFVESAAEEEGYITSYNHDAFRYAGRNYVGTMEQLTGIDINSPNTSKYGGFGGYITNGYYYFGKNVRRFVEGITNVSVYQDNSNAFYNAARNIKSFLEGIGGSSHPITGNYAANYKYAGKNIRVAVETFGDGNNILTTSDTTKFKNSQFKLRADQTFYDMYLNDKALKKAFKFASSFDPNNYKSGLTTITKKNEVSSLGGGGLDDTFSISVDASDPSEWGRIVSAINIALPEGVYKVYVRRVIPYSLGTVTFSPATGGSFTVVEKGTATSVTFTTSKHKIKVYYGEQPYRVYIDGKLVAEVHDSSCHWVWDVYEDAWGGFTTSGHYECGEVLHYMIPLKAIRSFYLP